MPRSIAESNFPANWIDKPEVLNPGMARDLLVSVAAMFDDEPKPIALCSRVDGREERFLHVQPSGPDGGSLLDELHRDLADESLHFGPADLLASMPGHPTNFGLGRISRSARLSSRKSGLATVR